MPTLRRYADLPFADTYCDDGGAERIAFALGIATDDVATVWFERRTVALTDATFACLWTAAVWAQEHAERPEHLGALAANLDQAPAPIVAPAVPPAGAATGAGTDAGVDPGADAGAQLVVVDGVHRINCALHQGRERIDVWVALPPAAERSGCGTSDPG